MRKSLIFIILLTGCLGVSAQSLRAVWIEMPDSIIPYLSRSQRTELADYVDMKAEPAVRDAFGDTVRIERMTDSYLSVRLSGSSRLEIRLLDKSTLALVRTWEAPAAESSLHLFSQLWQKKKAVVVCQETVSRPDTMSEEEFAELKSLAVPRMRVFHLPADRPSLSVSWSYPLLSAKDAKRVAALLKPKELEWTGTEFR
nr:DUF3256 family protein [Prevotella denticola]